MNDNPKFHLLVRSRDGKIYEGDVQSITSFNEKGMFDVLGQHANFISLIKDKLIIADLNGSRKDIPVNNGLMRVRENNVEVYLGVEGLSPTEHKGKK